MLETDGFMAPDWNLKTGGAYKDLYSCGLNLSNLRTLL